MEFLSLLVFLPILSTIVSISRTNKNSIFHRRYLDEISAINKREISNHIYNWEWRYDWLTKCYRSVSWWKFWQSIEKAYTDANKVLTEQTPDDMIPTYEIIPGFIKERNDSTR